MRYLAAGYLIINAWTDWRRKEIDCRYTALFIACACVLQLYRGESIYWNGLLPGLCLWGLSLGKKKGIGSGDGIITASLGAALGILKVWNIIVGGFFLAGAYGMVLWICGKKKETEIAFVPFLLISFFMTEWISGFT